MSNTFMVLYLTSASASAKDLSKGYARFDVSPVTIPADRRYNVGLQSMSFTNYMVNIGPNLNNDKFYVTNDLANLTKYAVTIPEGSYTVETLNTTINNALVNLGLQSNCITLTPDDSTNRVIFNFAAAGYMIYFPAGSCYGILGCPVNQKIPSTGTLTTGVYTAHAPLDAEFASVNMVYIKTSLTNSSIFCGRPSNIIGGCAPVVKVGSIQLYEPNNIQYVSAPALSGLTLNSIELYLVDQNDMPVELSDDFSANILIGSN